MNLKETQIVIDPEKPFANCKLGREKCAKALESIVSNTPEGCVIALNGEWGVGKTTFVRMWEQQLKNHGFKTVYFNAWETDFVSDPLVALIGELHGVLGGSSKTEFDNVIKAGEKIIRGAIPAIAKAFLKKYELDFLVDAAEELSKNNNFGLSGEIDQYKEECESLKSFRDALSELVETLVSDNPLVFFIDELDRCTPHYAVKLLERIKHLFSLSHIVFVLCIDKEQLCHSICGYYGSDMINAPEYLRRFIDVDYNLPEPDYDKFFDFMYSELKFDKIVFRDRYVKEQHLDKGRFFIAKLLFGSHKLSLRQIEKTLTHIRLTAQSISNMGELNIELLIVLVYFRQFLPEIYRKIRAREYDNQALVNDIEKFMPKSALQTRDQDKQRVVRELNDTIADLLIVYNNAVKYSNAKEEIYEGTNMEDMRLLFKTTLLDKEAIISEFSFYGNSPHRTQRVLQNTIEHIELLYELRPDLVEE